MPWKRPSRGGGIRSRRCFPARPFGFARAGCDKSSTTRSDIERAGRRAPWRGVGRHGDREQHVRSGPRGGQPAHGALWRGAWTRGRADAAGGGAVQRPGPGRRAAVSPIGRARRTDRGRGRPTALPAGEKIARFLRGYQQRDRPAANRLPASSSPIAISKLLAADAAKQWTGTFNPRPVGTKEFAGLYREVLSTARGDR